MSLSVSPFDPVDHIKTLADVADWLRIQVLPDHTRTEMVDGVLTAIEALERMADGDAA